MAYTKINWENEPSTDTPISATNLNNMDEGIYNLDNSGRYLAATAGTGGNFYINITTTLATNMKLRILFPTPTTGTSNAALSITGSGGTYKNILNRALVQLIANQLSGKYINMVYDGTEWIVENADIVNDADLGQYIEFSKTSNQSLTSGSETDIVWESSTNFNGANFASVSGGFITFSKTGSYIVTQTNVYDSNATGNRYVVLPNAQQRTVSVGASRVNATDFVTITSVGTTLVSRAYQNSGGNLNLTAFSKCKIIKVG